MIKLATLLAVEKVEWKTFIPNEFACTCCRDRRATLFARIADRDIIIKVAVCGACLHLLGAGGIAAVVEEGGDSS